MLGIRQGRDGLGWTVLGVATVALSAGMDRLAEQGVPPFAAPGLLPGLLGLLMVLSGVLLLLRRAPAEVAAAGPRWGVRLATSLGLCLAFSLGLIGHGLPFWLAASVFVTAAILVLHGDMRRSARGVASAVAIGVGAGIVATLVFQRIFLVQLP